MRHFRGARPQARADMPASVISVPETSRRVSVLIWLRACGRRLGVSKTGVHTRQSSITSSHAKAKIQYIFPAPTPCAARNPTICLAVFVTTYMQRIVGDVCVRQTNALQVSKHRQAAGSRVSYITVVQAHCLQQ